MPTYTKCPNHEYCGNYIEVAGNVRRLPLCDTCQQTAKALDRSVQEEARIEQALRVAKNPPRHRKRGGWWK